MPTTYKGKVEIRCLEELCIVEKIRVDVSADCTLCESSDISIIDLDDKPLTRIPTSKVVSVKKNKKED